MRSLKQIKEDLEREQPREAGKQHDFAAEAYDYTLDQKMLKSGSLKDEADALALIVEWFENNPPQDGKGEPINVDDLRYRLAHLLMRESMWSEAQEELTGIKRTEKYRMTEAHIYSAVCAIKEGEIGRAKRSIEEGIKYLTDEEDLPSASVQEHYHNLYELLIYAALDPMRDHKLLESYYAKGNTRASYEIRTNDNPKWRAVTRYRLEQRTRVFPQPLIIFENEDDELARKLGTDFNNCAPTDEVRLKVKRIAMLLAKAAYEGTRGVERDELAEKSGIAVKDDLEGRSNTNEELTRKVGLLRDLLGGNHTVENNRNRYSRETSTAYYCLKHPFIIVRKRKKGRF